MTAKPPETTWGAGEYAEMAEQLIDVAASAVDAVDVVARDRVLDVACGTGNAALVAALRGAASVTGVDFEPRLLAIARRRAAEADVRVRWEQGDVAALPVPDDAFDVVLSVFGVMYGPDQAHSAGELGRVCAPKARVAIASWIPGSFMPAMGGALAPFLPAPPAGGMPPARWGDEQALTALLEPAGIRMTTLSHDHVALHFAGPQEAVAFLVRTAGNVIAEQSHLEREGRWGALLDDLEALVIERNVASGGEVCLRLEYLLAAAVALR